MVDSDLNGPRPQVTLTCISTGGPATTVRWYRNSQGFFGAKNTVLVNAATADYIHTLTVTGRYGGDYCCYVYNNRPSFDSACTVLDSVHFPSVQLDPSPVNIYEMGVNRVLLKWTGSYSFKTRVSYKYVCNTTGRVVYSVSQAFSPGVGYHYFTLDDELDGFIHRFLLRYNVYCDQVKSPVLELDFSFGTYICVFNYHMTNYLFNIILQIRVICRFSLGPLITA